MLIRANIPSSVSSISVTMSCAGQKTLSDSLHLTIDSLITCSFPIVPVGKWSLLINAMDNGGNPIYYNQRQVLIQENTASIFDISFSISNAALQITLDWGSRPTDWIDYPGNPIFGKSQTDSISNGVLNPKILFQNGQYKMWFNYYQTKSNLQWIGYSTSQDGIHWTQPQPTDLTIGSSQTWDGEVISTGPVILINNQYFMYYTGTDNSTYQVGLATSANGINWTKKTNPVIAPSASWETLGIGATDIIQMGAVYYLYYHGIDANSNTAIGLATSPDGLLWVKSNTNPILQASESWELSGGIYFPSVIDDNGLLKMLYASRTPDNEGFGIATSFDGITWTKESTSPFFSVQSSQSAWARSIGYACWCKFGNEYNIYYSGIFRNIYSSDIYAIGLLKKK